MNRIKIKDSIGECLSVELKDILKHIDGAQYSWVLLNIWAVGETGLDINTLDVEQESEQQTGFRLSWDELLQFSSSTSQVIDGMILAIDSNQEFQMSGEQSSYYDKYTYTIEVCDSSYWIISSKDEGIVSKLKNIYSDVEII